MAESCPPVAPWPPRAASERSSSRSISNGTGAIASTSTTQSATSSGASRSAFSSVSTRLADSSARSRVGADHRRPGDQLGKDCIAQRRREAGSGADPGREADRQQVAARALAVTRRDTAERPVRIAEGAEGGFGPGRRIVQPLEVGGRGQGVGRPRLVHVEIFRPVPVRPVAPAPVESVDAHPFRHMLEAMPVVVVAVVADDVVPEHHRAIAQQRHFTSLPRCAAAS